MKSISYITIIRCILCSYFVWLMASTSYGQVPQLINYQGRVVVGNVNFDGNGLFKFALVNATGSTTYWSNNGSSVGGSQPNAAVSLPVSKGLYAVLLGDATLGNMSTVPSTVFNNADVRLRVWFNDGTNGFQLLTPDQRIAAVGYALMAGNVPDGAITNAKLGSAAVDTSNIAPGAITGPKIANGSIDTNKLAANAVQNGNIAAGAVDTTQIAAGAITTQKLAPGVVSFANLAKPPQSGRIDGSSLTYGFGQAAFTVNFPQAFASSPVVTLSLAPTQFGFPADATVQITSATATQFSGMVSAPQLTPVVIDGGNGEADGSSNMVLIQSKPAVAYTTTSATHVRALYYVRSINTTGSNWSTPTLIATNAWGSELSLLDLNGKPALCYADPFQAKLFYVIANDADGATWGAPIEIGTSEVGGFCSMQSVNGFPAIAYRGPNNELKYARAQDPAGAAWNPAITLDNPGNIGYCSLATVNGYPAVAYYSYTSSMLKYIRATNANGTAWGTPMSPDPGTSRGYEASLQVVNGSPAIAYAGTGGLRFVRATDLNGATWATPAVLDNVQTGSISLKMINGVPAVAYRDENLGNAKYVPANDANGTAWVWPATLEAEGSVGYFSSLQLVGTKPAVVHFDSTRNQLRFVRQAEDPSNFNINWIALPP